ncbi:hypothetical protein P9995_03240 [Glaesserella parasuis]|uniref:hypothetical protein n=1 Tax=Glaesserella parasuis TaxID=738 RepID=UPI002436FF9B|nr:hypothetical protein [Glaesserella parasuis]MDG6339185.1 hypothetical protein [Glaesserella parasuis]
MIDIKKEEQEIQNRFISFPDFMRLFTNKNPDVSLKKIVFFINNKIPDQYYFNVAFVEDDFLKIEDAFPSVFWDYLFSFKNSQTLGRDAEWEIEHADFDNYFLYKSEVSALFNTPSDLLNKTSSSNTEPDTITNNNNPDEIARLNAIIEQQAETIAILEAEVESLKKTETAQATQPPIADEDINKPTYNPDVLLKFIEEIINPELLEEDGKLPTYSRLYTKLSHKYPKKRVTTKNTIKKYLSQ